MEHDFEERPELTGSLISIEFGPGGRMQQLWAQDPGLPDEGEDFQFILPPIQFGEESSDDYYPGTILIGARTSPDESWIVSRNTQALFLSGFESENYDPSSVSYEYQFPFWEDIRATGRFYEVATPMAHICWDVEIRNAGRVSIEIGELGFPMAFNNYCDDFGWRDDQLAKLWNSRVYLHKYIGGGSSWLFAERMTAQAPGLLVFPGDDTSWEFYAHVPASLNTPYQWEGIPVFYAHSKATIERELWPEWFNDHTSLILEPGDSRRYQMKMVPIESDMHDGVHMTLAAFGKPTVKLLPSAVVPVGQGVSVEVQGHAPSKFYISREAQVATDHDTTSSFCYIQTDEPGALTVSFRDQFDKMCYSHLMFVEPLATLIQKRAQYIAKNQIMEDQNQIIHNAIVLTNIETGAKATEPEDFVDASGLESSLADALFLAEKNAIYPAQEEITVLNRYVRDFLLGTLQNPGNFAVASVIDESTQTATYFGRPLIYPHVFNLYHSLFRIATTYGGTEFSGTDYLIFSYRTAIAMFEQGWRLYVRTVGILGYARLYDLVTDLRENGLREEAEELHNRLLGKAQDLMKLKYPYAGESVLDTSGFEEVFAAARFMGDDDHLE
ncbi:MAG: DUF5695 domain-containing protein, partial [Fimbriimonadaceae bacterium]|nr:DUF5695 domain-containing protein [Fimbriimonadaceae bacterium]